MVVSFFDVTAQKRRKFLTEPQVPAYGVALIVYRGAGILLGRPYTLIGQWGVLAGWVFFAVNVTWALVDVVGGKPIAHFFTARANDRNVYPLPGRSAQMRPICACFNLHPIVFYLLRPVSGWDFLRVRYFPGRGCRILRMFTFWEGCFLSPTLLRRNVENSLRRPQSLHMGPP